MSPIVWLYFKQASINIGNAWLGSSKNQFRVNESLGEDQDSRTKTYFKGDFLSSLSCDNSNIRAEVILEWEEDKVEKNPN